MIPFDNVLSNNFMINIPEIISVRIASSFDNFIISNIQPKNIKKVIFKPWDFKLNNIDIAIVPVTKMNKLNFSPIANLHEEYFIFLCSDKISFRKISDLRNTSVNVYFKGSCEEDLMLKLISLNFVTSISLTYYTDDELLEVYGTEKCSIVLILSAHKSPIIHKLSKKIRSHFLNGGDIKLGENYGNKIINRNSLVPRLYPYITTIDKNSDLYLKSISIRMILIARNSVSSLEVSNMIARIIKLVNNRILRENPKYIFLKDIQLNLLNNVRSNEFHKGAYETYRIMNLITNEDNSHCIHWKSGVCPNSIPKFLLLKAKPLVSDSTNDYIDNYIKSWKI